MCAWNIAEFEVGVKYSDRFGPIALVNRPIVRQRSGVWYDAELGKWLYGLTYLDDDPAITIAVTGDADEDFDTACHEFKHYIVQTVGIEGADEWIDGNAR